MLKGLKDFFNPSKQKMITQVTQAREVTFNTSSKNNQKEQDQDNPINNCSTVDLRYDKLQQIPSLQSLGFKKYQIQYGEVPVLYDKSSVWCKLSNDKYQQTILVVTNFKICLHVKNNQPVYFVLGKIDKLTKDKPSQGVLNMEIHLKDGRSFYFKVNNQDAWKKNYQRIQMFAFIRHKKHFFSYRHFQHNKKIQEQFQGWKLYNLTAQFERMGIKLMSHTEMPIDNFTSDFKILDNKSGKICSTYPPILVVPSRMPYDALVRCARFRSRQRIPVLSFAYQYEEGKFSAVYRSSQSKVGVQNNRSSDDELMLRIIGNHKLDPKNQAQQTQNTTANCKIYDARKYIAALGNKISGKGFEDKNFYTNCQFQFLNIPNIHAVRDAYSQTLSTVFGPPTKFHIGLAQTKWYEYIFLILFGALDLATSLSTGLNCLVHCSDGWDRTAQLCSLSSMILDPYYRTFEGLMVLIEKDWIYFGHQFVKRLGQGVNNPMSQEKSQVFLQFLDCITQIMHQFPSEFQFNYRIIQEIAEQAYSNLYGNFISNCYFDMEKANVPESTVSLWSKLRKDKKSYMNTFYNPVEKTLLNLDPNQKNMRFWREHFLQNDQQFTDVYGIYSCRFTEDNLQIIHQQAVQEKLLLQQKYSESQQQVRTLDNQINKLTAQAKAKGCKMPQSTPQGQTSITTDSPAKQN